MLAPSLSSTTSRGIRLWEKRGADCDAATSDGTTRKTGVEGGVVARSCSSNQSKSSGSVRGAMGAKSTMKTREKSRVR